MMSSAAGSRVAFRPQPRVASAARLGAAPLPGSRSARNGWKGVQVATGASGEGGESGSTATERKPAKEQPAFESEEKERLRNIENELKDPANFIEYFLPRPLRLAFFGASSLGCFLASLFTASRLIKTPALAAEYGEGTNLIINIAGLIVFSALYFYDTQGAEVRVQRRQRLRTAQIEFGDREVFINDEGEKMSKLKEVDDDWILRRLERWGKRDMMPFVGPDKGKILQGLVAEKDPELVVEVGTMCGYSAILMAQSLADGCRVLTIEKDFLWMMSAKRFMWQCSQGEVNKQRAEPLGDKVDVRWGDALEVLPKLDTNKKIDFLFLDGVPKEYLSYLKAAEPLLADGAVIVADNTGVFGEGGLKPYLEYVRGSPSYDCRTIDGVTLEWRPDVPDEMEVSIYNAGA